MVVNVPNRDVKVQNESEFDGKEGKDKVYSGGGGG